MARLAWFTPWPPSPSGVAGRSADAVRGLASRGYAVDVFVADRPANTLAPDAPLPGQIRLESAHEFVWRRARGQYDLTIYQLGNSRAHEFIWPYLFRWPGLVVLHDARLHHARSRALLPRGRHADYRAEFTANHPDVGPAAAEFAVRGFDGLYYYQWPMLRTVAASARLVAAHTRRACDDLADLSLATPTAFLPLGEGRLHPIDDGARRAFRRAHHIADAAVVFGVFGGLTANKRVPSILSAFAATRARVPNVHLLLAGAPDRSVDLEALTSSLGIADATTIAPGLDEAGFDTAIAAADVSLNLRWPTSVETSGPWLRALAAGRATVVTDLLQTAHLPMLDPRTWRRHEPCAAADRDDATAVAVSIDILDEDHSLRLAMRRLSTDAALRDRLGRAARTYWEATHTVPQMIDGYERLIAQAIALPDPHPVLPAHVRPDPLAGARAVLAAFMSPDVARALDALESPCTFN